jgi:hypothetical protein
MHADFSFSFLRFAEAASFDKKELRRSCTGTLKSIFSFETGIFVTRKYFTVGRMDIRCTITYHTVCTTGGIQDTRPFSAFFPVDIREYLLRYRLTHPYYT